MSARKRPSTPGFRDFVAPAAALVATLPRQRYAGLAPADAAKLIIGDYHAMRSLAGTTRRQKEYEFRRILADLAERGLDLATATAEAMTEYRAYLQADVAAGLERDGLVAVRSKGIEAGRRPENEGVQADREAGRTHWNR